MRADKKRILITGAGSYLGNSVEKYLMEWNAETSREHYWVDIISLRRESWEDYDFSPYHTVFHVAGIAHADVGKVSEDGKKLYYQVNRDLAVRAAGKAKKQGVSQFIYMSSMIVYGEGAPPGGDKKITFKTVPSPAGFYGDSKLQAEKALQELSEDGFQVAIVRAPVIYGRGSKGNYPLLSKLAEKTPIFPDIKNERSMLYVENFCEFIRLLADSGLGGVFYPQNKEYAVTSHLVKSIGRVKGKKILLCRALNPLVYLAAKLPGKMGGMVNKAFGSIAYEQSMSKCLIDGYQRFSLEESVERMEE